MRNRKAAAVAAGLLLGIAGCDQEAVTQLVATSGAFVGEVSAILATRYLELAFDVEAEASAEEHADEHTHSATSMHDHEH